MHCTTCGSSWWYRDQDNDLVCSMCNRPQHAPVPVAPRELLHRTCVGCAKRLPIDAFPLVSTSVGVGGHAKSCRKCQEASRDYKRRKAQARAS